MATVSAYANAIAFLPSRDAHSKSIKAAGNFMARHTRILQPRPEPFFYQHVAVADPAGFHFYPHLPRALVREYRVQPTQNHRLLC